jgi:hypothetical protein
MAFLNFLWHILRELLNFHIFFYIFKLRKS